MYTNEGLKEKEKEREREREERRPCSADDLETKAVLSSPPAAQTNTIIDEE